MEITILVAKATAGDSDAFIKLVKQLISFYKEYLCPFISC